jgi:hypothetical protein
MYKFTSILLVMVLNANINVNALNEAKFDGMVYYVLQVYSKYDFEFIFPNKKNIQLKI